jgi:hypothetical protein
MAQDKQTLDSFSIGSRLYKLMDVHGHQHVRAAAASGTGTCPNMHVPCPQNVVLFTAVYVLRGLEVSWC